MPRVEKVKINVKERLEDNTLDLSMSNLTEVPIKDIIPLKRATIIDLSSNNLQYLGKTFTTLTQLTRLDLSKNNLTILPDDFGNLKNLRHLDLYNNKLEHVPISFGNLKSLKYLDLKGNPLTPALAKIIGPCLTTKDCTDAAKNTVKIMTDMQRQVSVERDRLKQEAIEQEAISKAELDELEKPKRKSKKERKLEQQQKEDEIKNASTSLEYDLSGSSNTSIKQAKKSSSFFTKVFFTFLLILLSLALFSYVTIAYPNEVYGLLNKIHPKLEKWVEVKMGEVNEYTYTAFDSFMTTYLA